MFCPRPSRRSRTPIGSLGGSTAPCHRKSPTCVPRGRGPSLGGQPHKLRGLVIKLSASKFDDVSHHHAYGGVGNPFGVKVAILGLAKNNLGKLHACGFYRSSAGADIGGDLIPCVVERLIKFL